MSSLLSLQRRIYRSFRDEANRVLGKSPRMIREYSAEFESEMRRLTRKMVPTRKSDLVTAIRAHEVTLISDFHTFPQAGRTALRLIRDSVRRREKWFVGLEMVASHRQSALDGFIRGRLDTDELKARIEYQESWGFPWGNYAPLLEWAREHSVALLALDRPKQVFLSARTSDLHARDRWAAGIITDVFSAAPKGVRVAALFGELHLASSHLPREIRAVSAKSLGRELKTLSIHQNLDDVYWKLARQGRAERTDAIRFKKDAFCVISGTPWSKLQSLVDWADGSGMDEHEAGPHDHVTRMRESGAIIARYFGVPEADFGDITVKSIADADEMPGLVRSAGYSSKEARLVKTLVEANQRFYLSRGRIAYLGSASPNAEAELAAAHLFGLKHRSSSLRIEGVDAFYRHALKSMRNFLGSLILNPRRKCDLPEDHLSRLKEIRNGARETFKSETYARKLALDALKAPLSPRKVARLSRSPADGAALFIAAQYLGKMLAKSLHARIAAGMIKPAAAIQMQGPASAQFARLTTTFKSGRVARSSKHDTI